MLIFIIRLILSPICLLIDFLNIVVGFLMWDGRFVKELDDETNAFRKIFTPKEPNNE